MKVWIVTYDTIYGSGIQKVFDSEEKARAYIKLVASSPYDCDIEECEVE